MSHARRPAPWLLLIASLAAAACASEPGGTARDVGVEEVQADTASAEDTTDLADAQDTARDDTAPPDALDAEVDADATSFDTADTPCVPACGGRACGGDGCGGSCGSCGPRERCGEDGVCACVPDCTGADACADDGCGHPCTACDDRQVCTDGDACVDGQCRGAPRRSLGSLGPGESRAVTGSTLDEPGAFSASCGDGAGGPDAEYAFDAPVRAGYRFLLAAADFDAVLHLRGACDDLSSLCSATGADAALPELATFLDPGPGFVIVDGQGPDDAGAFELRASAIPHLTRIDLTEEVAAPHVTTNGEHFTFDRCRDGDVLVGLAIQLAKDASPYFPAIIRVAGLCGGYNLTTEDGTSYQGAASAWSTQLPWRGTDTDGADLGTVVPALCPAGKVLVGFVAKTGITTGGGSGMIPHIRRLVLSCASLLPEGDDVVGVTLATRAIGDISGVGQNSGTAQPKVACPLGSVAGGLDTLDAEIVQGIGLRCYAPVAVP